MLSDLGGQSPGPPPGRRGREPANPRLRSLAARVRDAAERIGSVVITWVPADTDGEAHALVAEALAPR